MAKQNTYDVVIVGAGPAGAMCARACAGAGLRTLVLEARSPARHGWTLPVELERSLFSECGVPEPSGDEIAFHARGVKTFAPSGKLAFEVAQDPAFPVKQDVLTRRLVGYAKQAGAEVRYGVRVEAPLLDGARLSGVRVQKAGGESQDIAARIVVDASGHAAALIRQLPAECGIDFADLPGDQVIAEARLCRIERRATERAAKEGRFVPEYTHFRLGTQGTYSTLGFMVSLEQDRAFLLSGFKADHAPPTPGQVLDELTAELGCLTEIFHSGAGKIRICRASSRFVCDGFAAVGEAANMVVPMGASGVGSGMLAGDALGQRIGKILQHDGAATTKSLWPWCAWYQRGRGAILASYDATRRMMEKLDPKRDIEKMASSGLMTAEDLELTFSVQPVRPSLTTIRSRLVGALRQPALAAKIAPGLLHAAQVEAYWRHFPQHWNPDAFATWKETAGRLLP